MKKNSILEKGRQAVAPEVKVFSAWYFDIVDRIHEVLEAQNKTQKDFAKQLGKNESEISKWMRGNHNFTLETLAKIQVLLGETLIEIPTKDNVVSKCTKCAIETSKATLQRVQSDSFRMSIPTQDVPKKYRDGAMIYVQAKPVHISADKGVFALMTSK